MNLQSDVRGTSNLVGFVLLFSVVSMLCGLLMSTYASDLHKDEEELRLSLAGRQLRILQGSLSGIAHSTSSATVFTEIGLKGGHRLTAISTSFSNSYMTIGNDSAVLYRSPLGSVEYSTPFASVRLEGGAVVRHEINGESMVHPPSWFIADKTLVIEIFRLECDDIPATRGGFVVLEGQYISTQRSQHEWDPSKPMTVFLRTSSPGAWADYLSSMGMTTTITDGEVVAAITGIRELELIEHNIAIRRLP